jgi:hypothetical protein
MHIRSARGFRGAGALVLLFLIPISLRAQATGATISGTVTGATGKPVPGARVTATNLATGQSKQAETNGKGFYSFSDLAAGKYAISASAIALNSKTETVTLTAGAKQTGNFALVSALSLSSLGFSAAQTQGSPKEQALLNKRSHMLQVHQKLGLIAAIPMVATVVTSFRAHGRHTTASARDLHIALGSATEGLYWATAYYAIFAPKVKGVKARGAIRFHKAMAWIHGPGMILTPVLGAMAESQLNQGERLHGAAKYHGDVALVTAVAYGLALVSIARPHLLANMGHDAGAIFGFHHSGTENASKRDAKPGVEAAARDSSRARSDLAFAKNAQKQIPPAFGTTAGEHPARNDRQRTQ